MRPRDWFEVGARLIGLWILTIAIEDAREVLLIYLGIFTPATTPIISYWTRFGMHAAVGAGLVLVAGVFTDALFGRAHPSVEVMATSSDRSERSTGD